MASINNEAANTRKMREHQQRKLLQQELPSQEETDLIMCSPVVDVKNSVALNRSVKYADFQTVMLANPEDLALVSDVDHQLLLKLLFKEPVSLTSVAFRAEKLPECTNAEEYSGPKVIKCFANLEDLDFVDTESTNPAQVITLAPKQLSGERIPLRGSRFSRCLSVQFFVESNQNDTEFTFLNRICLLGRLSPLYRLD